MLGLGPHAAFIVAAYAVTFAAVAALALFIVEDDRKQRRLIAELEQRGIRRRSAGGEAAKPGKTRRKRAP
jgi:heme exporter protein D